MHQLDKYPGAIARVQTQLNELDFQIEQMNKIIKQIELETDLIIAFDKLLYNDAQRKAKRQQLLNEHPWLWEFQEDLSELKGAWKVKNVYLCQLRDEFSVAKLERRETIARLELQVI